MNIVDLISQISPEFLKANQDTIDEILFEKLQHEPKQAEVPDYSEAIVFAAFWICLGLALMGAGIGGTWK
jgi:hypothetical protein